MEVLLAFHCDNMITVYSSRCILPSTIGATSFEAIMKVSMQFQRAAPSIIIIINTAFEMRESIRVCAVFGYTNSQEYNNAYYHK